MCMTKKYWRIGLIVLVIGLLAFGGAIVGLAEEEPFVCPANRPLVVPTKNPENNGNPGSFADLGIEIGDACYETKVDSPTSGTVTLGGFDVHYEVYGDGKYFRFWNDQNLDVVQAVIIKGGPHANLYDYAGVFKGDRKGGTTLDHPVSEDCNLVSPDHPRPGQIPGVSHFNILVCPPPTGCLEVEKVWAGPYDPAELPTSITVKVFDDAAKTDDDLVATLTLEPDDWKDEVCNLPTGTYYVEEIGAPAGFTTAYSATSIAVVAGETAEITITNTYIPPECNTAMVRMNDDPNDFTYKFDGHPWFSYLIHKPTTEKVTFFFYSHLTRVGEVDIWKDNDFLYIQINLDSGYTLSESHIDVRLSKPRSIAFGTYPYSADANGYAKIPWQTSWTGKALYIVVHGVVCGDFSNPSNTTNTNSMTIQTFGTMDADTVDNEANASSAPEAPGAGAPAKHGVDGQTFGVVVSEKAQEDPLGLVDHLLDVYKP